MNKNYVYQFVCSLSFIREILQNLISLLNIYMISFEQNKDYFHIMYQYIISSRISFREYLFENIYREG